MLEPNKDDTTFLEPKKGLNEVYDNISKKINNTMHSLNEILEYWKKTLKCPTIKFTHTKQRYQLDIENKYVEGDKRPSEFILVGKTKKTLRFYTQEIEDKVTDLKELEDQKQEQLIPFIMEYIEKFYKHKDLWFHTISCLSEIDCYCSLAKCATKMGEESCQPEFTNKNMFELKNMYHPCLMKAGYKMVPNDTEFKEGVTGLLVTGPNMGGKSTLLRQTCLAVILAQIGSFVPAKSFLLKPVDRIFCRIGANDKLLEGKSTFFVEMEETQVIVQEATQDSIVLLDELGRGTSTYDGVSIAYSVLKHLMEEIKCKVLFATHYHSLLDDFKLYKNVENYMMDYSYNSQDKKLSFTYKFVKGESDRSFGVNCAKVVGLCEEIQNLAEEKEREMNSECEQLGKDRIKNQNFNSIISALLENSHKKSIQQLTQLTKTLKI